MAHTTAVHDADCGACPLQSPELIARRRFLQLTGLTIAPLLLAALGARDAGALAVARREEKRYPLPVTDGVSIDRDNGVMLARTPGKVYAFSLACPHQNTALRWDDGDHEFKCPKHKSHYRADGTFIEGRATRAMDRLAIRRDGSVLVVDVDRMFRQDENPAEWAGAVVVLTS
jgi:Rieske Fe-S protein